MKMNTWILLFFITLFLLLLSFQDITMSGKKFLLGAWVMGFSLVLFYQLPLFNNASVTPPQSFVNAKEGSMGSSDMQAALEAKLNYLTELVVSINSNNYYNNISQPPMKVAHGPTCEVPRAYQTVYNELQRRYCSDDYVKGGSTDLQETFRIAPYDGPENKTLDIFIHKNTSSCYVSTEKGKTYMSSLCLFPFLV